MNRNSPSLYHFFLFITLAVVCLPASQAFANDRGRNEWSMTFDGSVLFGRTDREHVFFDMPSGDFNQARAGGRIGVEGNFPGHFSVKLRAGYEKLFYTSVGAAQIEHDFILTEALLSYYFFETPGFNRWDPYISAGPALLINKDGRGQGYLAGAIGTRFFFNDDLSLRLEGETLADFAGYSGTLLLGLGVHF